MPQTMIRPLRKWPEEILLHRDVSFTIQLENEFKQCFALYDLAWGIF